MDLSAAQIQIAEKGRMGRNSVVRDPRLNVLIVMLRGTYRGIALARLALAPPRRDGLLLAMDAEDRATWSDSARKESPADLLGTGGTAPPVLDPLALARRTVLVARTMLRSVERIRIGPKGRRRKKAVGKWIVKR